MRLQSYVRRETKPSYAHGVSLGYLTPRRRPFSNLIVVVSHDRTARGVPHPQLTSGQTQAGRVIDGGNSPLKRRVKARRDSIRGWHNAA